MVKQLAIHIIPFPNFFGGLQRGRGTDHIGGYEDQRVGDRPVDIFSAAQSQWQRTQTDAPRIRTKEGRVDDIAFTN